MARKRRITTREAVEAIRSAEICLKEAIAHLKRARTPQSLKKLQSALKSVQGADRHARARMPEPVWFDHRAKAEGWMIWAPQWTEDGRPINGRIMRWDTTFGTNAEATRHVIQKARQGEEYHQTALRLVGMMADNAQDKVA